MNTSELSLNSMPMMTWLDTADGQDSYHMNEVHQLDVNCYGSVLSASVDGILCLWRPTQRHLSSLSPIRLYPLSDQWHHSLDDSFDGLLCSCVLLDPQDTWAAAGYEDGSVSVWRVSDGHPLHRFEPSIMQRHSANSNRLPGPAGSTVVPASPVIALLLNSVTLSHLIVVRQNGQLQQWNLISGICEHTWYHTATSMLAAMSSSTPTSSRLTAAHMTSNARYIYTAAMMALLMFGNWIHLVMYILHRFLQHLQRPCQLVIINSINISSYASFK
ncbi:hypothetical protein BDF19DRAFT_27799 [Syncephalis fuscata]|nr:hypothetical protein BDF19DRAFT_27799 [Syncephalis fuscata]